MSGSVTERFDRPRLSVVIASTNGDTQLQQCVNALAPQAGSGGIEIFIVRASDRPSTIDRRSLMADSPAFRWIDAPAGATVPQLRGVGIAASSADAIAMLEDDCVVNPDWCRVALSAIGSSAAVGGAVEPGPYLRALDWAVYFAEYGRFMLPLPSVPNSPLTGNNVVYSRGALAALPPDQRANFREAFIHAAWQREGVPTAVSGALVVRNVNSWSSAHVTSLPYHHGRAFAGERMRERSPILRAGVAVLMLGLPLLKLVRIVRDALGRGRFIAPLVRAFPWIVVFVTCWSAGEVAGCLRGPGSSPLRWR